MSSASFITYQLWQVNSKCPLNQINVGISLYMIRWFATSRCVLPCSSLCARSSDRGRVLVWNGIRVIGDEWVWVWIGIDHVRPWVRIYLIRPWIRIDHIRPWIRIDQIRPWIRIHIRKWVWVGIGINLIGVRVNYHSIGVLNSAIGKDVLFLFNVVSLGIKICEGIISVPIWCCFCGNFVYNEWLNITWCMIDIEYCVSKPQVVAWKSFFTRVF